MGWFARGIVYVLFAMSLFVVTVAVRKLIHLGRARAATLRFSSAFSAALTAEDFETARDLVDAFPASHLAAAFRRVFHNLAELTRDHVLSAAEVASIQRTIELNTLEQLARFRRGLGVLATIGATAPFVGLLGTTMGVVNSFTGMAEMGTGGLAAVSAGIAEALITTAFGLLVAIPAVWLYNYFINRIDFVAMEVTYATKEFIDFLLRFEARLNSDWPGYGHSGSAESAVAIMDTPVPSAVRE
jgi:biopolymer transport protein ExbB/biopolymer transport protein TolQ